MAGGIAALNGKPPEGPVDVDDSKSVSAHLAKAGRLLSLQRRRRKLHIGEEKKQLVRVTAKPDKAVMTIKGCGGLDHQSDKCHIR